MLIPSARLSLDMLSPKSRRGRRVDCRFPAILKPELTERNPFTAAKAWRANDRASLLARYEKQRRSSARRHRGPGAIPGGGDAQFSYAAVWSGESRSPRWSARRTRQYPVDFGASSTFVETIDHDAVEQAANRYLASLQFSGLVEVEFKFDARDRRYKLLDVNPRPWTWIAVGGAAGVDLPLIEWSLARGELVPPSRGRAGVGWRMPCATLLLQFS